MEIDAQDVIRRLLQRIADQEYQIAVLQAGLARYEGQVDDDTDSTP